MNPTDTTLMIVSGPNGSGKTTLALNYASKRDVAYIGADAIAAILAPEDPAIQQLEAGRRFIEQVTAIIDNRSGAVIETTGAGRTMVRYISAA